MLQVNFKLLCAILLLNLFPDKDSLQCNSLMPFLIADILIERRRKKKKDVNMFFTVIFYCYCNPFHAGVCKKEKETETICTNINN